MTTTAEKRSQTIKRQLRRALLTWYDRHARLLPWRVGPHARRDGVVPDPYRVWLSEVMLQQTTTVHAAPYFERFTARWPTVVDLAAARDEELMGAWAGLGYYARARNLLACARSVATAHGGVFPDDEARLRALPGVGGYTAAAVAAIAFDRPANVVDGNVERVMARLFAIGTPLPAAKPALARLAGGLTAEDRPGDWAQALMDLGATVCRPRQPSCEACPAGNLCAGRRTGSPERYPVRAAKKRKPRRQGVAWVLLDGTGRVAVTRRPARELLGGMLGLPTSEWSETPDATPPLVADWREAGAIEHVFTHFTLSLTVFAAISPGPAPETCWWSLDEAAAALPTVFRKALQRGVATFPTHEKGPSTTDGPPS